MTTLSTSTTGPDTVGTNTVGANTGAGTAGTTVHSRGAGHPRNERMLTLDALCQAVDAGDIDTVILGFTDMQGRLQGKLLHGRFFVDTVVEHGTEGCNYLLAVDVDMNTVDGYAISSWEKGYGDMVFVPDWDTIRIMPHLEKTALVQCDLAWLNGEDAAVSPRSILKRQVDRAASHGWRAFAGTELEFVVYENTYEDAFDRGYRGLTPANQYNVDYSLLGSSRVEPLLRRIRNAMYDAGLNPESAKGECNLGQHEIAFLFADVVATADNHSVYKLSAKQIAAQAGKSITFMAKPNEREGSSCHIHMSLRGEDGEIVFWDAATGSRTPLYDYFIAGILATMREFTLFYAPNINSYKRFAEGSFAPTAVAWGIDNRTCSLRLVGHGSGARVENRLPGGDVNPYLALAAMLAGGLYGIEHELPLEPETEGNAYTAGAPRVPVTLHEAREALAASTIAREVFGDDVVDHYLNYADVELAAFDAAVTDWELRRGFERL